MVVGINEARAELGRGDDGQTVDTLTRLPAAGLAVACTDGYAGHIRSVTLDKGGRLCAVTVRLGRLWGREVDVPAGWIEAHDQASLRLTVERRRLRELPSRRSTAETVADANRALHAAGIVRASDSGDVSVTLCNGEATLSGHVGTFADRLNAESVLRQVPGVRGVQDDLVADDDLVNLVAQALANDERTRSETIFVAASHGVVILSGLRNSSKARAAAEECAGQVSSVRGVSNYIETPGAVVAAAEERVLQPRIGQEVFANDMSLGRVERVIVNPRNRRVVAVLVNGPFPEQQRARPSWRSYETRVEERRLRVSAADIDFVTPTVVQLRINGAAAVRGDDFAPRDFVQPDRGWRAPYPFTATDCLWARS